MTESGRQRIAQGRLTIRARLIGGALVVLLLLVISGLVNFWAQTQLYRATSAFQQEAGRVAAAREVAWASADLLATSGHAVSWQDVAYLTETLDTALATLDDVSDGLSGAMADLPEDDEVQVETRHAHEHMLSLESLAEQMISSAEAEDWLSVQFYQTQMLRTYRLIVVESLERVVTLTEERQAAAAAVAATARQLAMFVPAGFAALALAVTAITIWAAVRSITGPVEQLARGATRLAEGHLEERVPAGRRDELGRLAAVFNEMADRIQSSYAHLEERVAERTRDLERRSVQLEAAAQVAREAAAIRDPRQLLDETVRLISDQFGFYHAGIFLLDEPREYAVLAAASSEGGQRMLTRGHQLRVGEVGIVGYVASTGEPRVALDVGEDAVFFDNPDLPETRSEMALPLKVRERVTGVLDVQSREPGAFAAEDVAILQTMADQVALALENARLLEERQRALRELEALYARHVREGWRERVAREPVAYRYTRVGVEPAPPSLALEMGGPPPGNRPVVQQEEDGHRVIAPIRLRGQALGSIVLRRDPEESPWSPQEVALVGEVSTQVALALENARLLEETQRHAQRDRLIADITTRVRSSMHLETILQTAVRELGAAFGTDRAVVQLTGVPGVVAGPGEGAGAGGEVEGEIAQGGGGEAAQEAEDD